MSSPKPPPRGIQSIEVGGGLLRALMAAGRPLPLKDLAAAAGMAPAKAHPYLVSFGRLGLIEQAGDGAPYALGPLARELGLISLQQHDPVRLASAQLEGLAARLDMTVGLAIWGPQGVTVVRVEHPPSPVHISLRHGGVLSLNLSASGQVLAAGQDWARVWPLWKKAEPKAHAHEVQAHLAQVRAQGWALSEESLVPGVAALAVPVFDAQARATLALVALAPRGQWLPRGRVNAAALQQMQDVASGVSAQLGHRSEA